MGDRPPESRRGLYGERKSASADTARLAEIERVWAMTPAERIAQALELGRRMRRLRTASGERDE